MKRDASAFSILWVFGFLLRIGDCLAPATIAAAVYDGHRVAREMDNRPDPDSVPFKREQSIIDPP